MIPEPEGYLSDTLESVAKDSYRQISSNKTAFIYNDWVLERTKELLDEKGISYLVRELKDNGEFLCYQINNKERNKKYEERRNKK